MSGRRNVNHQHHVNAAFVGDGHGDSHGVADPGDVNPSVDGKVIYENPDTPPPHIKSRPNNLKLLESRQNRPDSLHLYEELPLDKKGQIQTISTGDVRYTPYPSPPPISTMPSTSTLDVDARDSRVNSNFGSDVTMFRDNAGRKRENPLYGVSQRSSSYSLKEGDKPCHTCCGEQSHKVFCALIVIISILLGVLLVMVILILSGLITTKPEPVPTVTPTEDPQAKAMAAELKLLQAEVEKLRTKVDKSGEVNVSTDVEGAVVKNTNDIMTLNKSLDQLDSEMDDEILKLYKKNNDVVMQLNNVNNRLQKSIITAVDMSKKNTLIINDVISDLESVNKTVSSLASAEALLKCTYVIIKNTESVATGATIWVPYYPQSEDFYLVNVLMTHTCSVSGGAQATPEIQTFSADSSNFQYRCKCDKGSKAAAGKLECRLHALICPLTL